MLISSHAPVLITGGGKRIGLAIAKHLLNQHIPVVVTYRTYYSSLNDLEKMGAVCIQADFSTTENIHAFANELNQRYSMLRAVIHNASEWIAENPDIRPEETLREMLQIHVYTPFILNQLLAPSLLSLKETRQGLPDIIHLTDYVVEKGSARHIAYAASKAALDNMTRSFAQKYAPSIKVNAIAPALIMSNEGDSEEYQRQAREKSLMQIIPGEQEIVNAVNYLFNSHYITGTTLHIDGGRSLR